MDKSAYYRTIIAVCYHSELHNPAVTAGIGAKFGHSYPYPERTTWNYLNTTIGYFNE